MPDDSTKPVVKSILKLLPSQGNGEALPPGGEGKGGGARRMRLKPDPADLEYYSSLHDEAERAIAEHPLVKATRSKVDSLEMLWSVKEYLAKGAANLDFQRMQFEKEGRDTVQISHKQAEVLKKLADVELDIKKLGMDNINLQGDKIQRIFRYWIDTLREVVQEVMTPEQSDLFFNRLQTMLEGWEQKVAELIR